MIHFSYTMEVELLARASTFLNLSKKTDEYEVLYVPTKLSYKQLSLFFIPLGISASLTSFTHIIINGTLSRGEDAAFIIAAYAVAMSLFGIIERPILVFRQASSALVTDRYSFKLVHTFFIYVLCVIIAFCMLLGYTPLGQWVYMTFFNATSDMISEINISFRIITFVAIFSGFRSIYQGVIINQLATNWVTLGVVVRVIGMFFTAYLIVVFDVITSAAGAFIFVIGMAIEALISMYKGKDILKNTLSYIKEGATKLRKIDVSRFYFPLAFYFILQALLMPIIYILLAKSSDIEMGIASFALAFSITQLMLSFFMYTHQLVLQFYKEHKQTVVTFLIFISIIPTLLLCLLSFTPVGPMFMMKVMGADEALSVATLSVLKFFIIKTLVFPWVDFLNGFLMLTRQTNRMLLAQVGNLIVVTITLLILINVTPQLNGVNGSIAASLGELAGFVIVCFIVYQLSDRGKARRMKKAKLRK